MIAPSFNCGAGLLGLCALSKDLLSTKNLELQPLQFDATAMRGAFYNASYTLNEHDKRCIKHLLYRFRDRYQEIIEHAPAR